MNSETSYYQPTEVLPPLMVDGIPTPLDKMTQAQLRAFIPVMLKYSTGRTKPAWGRPTSRPPWWPEDVPWANVRSDVRTDEEKQRQSWTNALKKVVRCCYEYHGKTHYLHDYTNGANLSNQDMMDHQHQMMEHEQLIDMEGHQNVEYSHHEHIQNQVSGRHMLLNEHDAVEAQLRALQSSYSILNGRENNVESIQISGGSVNDYGSLNNESNLISDSHMKVEDFVNLPPGTVVQLDSNSTVELFNLLTSGVTNDQNLKNESEIMNSEQVSEQPQASSAKSTRQRESSL